MAGKELSGIDLVLRFVGPLLLVLITYNPSGVSFYHWLADAVSGDGFGGIHFLALVVLVIGSREAIRKRLGAPAALGVPFVREER